MRQAKLYHYQIPIDTQFVLKDKQLKNREGLFVCLKESDRTGWGEISPLYGFSNETLAMATSQVIDSLKGWQNNETMLFEKLFPSVAFGLSMAKMELAQPLPCAQYQPVLLCNDSSDNTLARLSNARLAKLKIARLSPKADGINAARLLSSLPQLRLRLDANRAWHLSDALEFANAIPKHLYTRIDFIEEPCQTPKETVLFAKQTSLNFAWDETTREADFSLSQLDYFSTQLKAIILKPTLIGTVEKNHLLIQKAHQLGLQAVISSSLETSLGLSQLAQLSHLFTPNTPAGLDTLSLMPVQLIRPFAQTSLPLFDIHSNYITEIPLK